LNVSLSQIDPYEWIIILTVIVSLFKKSKLKYFNYFIWFVFIFELFFEYYYKLTFGNNIKIYDAFGIICISYYLFIFQNKYKSISEYGSKISGTIIILWLLVVSLRLVLIKNELFVDSINYNSGMLIVLFLIFAYVKNIIDTKHKELSSEYPFLLFAMGIVLFYTSSFPLITFINLLVTNKQAISAYSHLLQFGNIFLSLAYLGAVLCTKKEVQCIG
jgi:hypothetical protein